MNYLSLNDIMIWRINNYIFRYIYIWGEVMKEINCNRLKSTVSLNRVRKYFNSIGEGEAIVFVDDEISSGNIIKYAMGKGYHVESEELVSGFEIIIEKRGCLEVIEEPKDLVVLVTTNRFGQGDDILGENLMISYFDALIEEDRIPTKLVFLNGGVKLVSEGSKVIDAIRLLNEMGAKIYVSKMSIEVYQLEDMLLIGEIVQMGSIVEFMNCADDVIKL